MKAFEELSELAKQLEAEAAKASAKDIKQPLQALKEAADQVSRAFSGSWRHIIPASTINISSRRHPAKNSARNGVSSIPKDTVAAGVNTVAPT
jgi:hypothetical protein